MPWLRFTATHIYTPADRRTAVKYREGARHNVKRDWAPELIARGVAVPTRAPNATERKAGDWLEETADVSGTSEEPTPLSDAGA